MRAAVAGALERRSLGSEVHTNSEKLVQLQDELQQLKMEEEIVRTAARFTPASFMTSTAR